MQSLPRQQQQGQSTYARPKDEYLYLNFIVQPLSLSLSRFRSAKT